MPVVDTTMLAEQDFAHYNLSGDFVEKIARELVQNTLSRFDDVIGDVRVRTIDDFDISFFLGRKEDKVIITIGSVLPISAPTRLAQLIKTAKILGQARTILGV